MWALAATAAYVALAWRYSIVVDGTRWFSLSDDPMISMRYAENLVAGRGLVWNEGERVEGITNPLWTLVMAAWHAAGVPKNLISLAVSLTGLLLTGVTAGLMSRLARRWRPDDRAFVTAALLATATAYPLLYWGVEGFEVPLAAALTCAVLLEIDGFSGRFAQAGRLALWLSLLALTRLDAFAIAGAALVPGFVRERELRRPMLGVAGVAGVTVLATFLLRRAYYGEWWPNTYVLKMTGVSIVDRVVFGLPRLGGSLASTVLVSAALVAIGLRKGLLTPRSVPALATFAAACAYSIWIGGDTWERPWLTNRFVTAALPALLIVAFEVVRAWKPGRFVPIVIALALSVSGVGFARWLSSDVGSWRLFDHVRLALELRATFPPRTRVAVVWAGALPYFTAFYAIDQMGKCDAVIARGPANGLVPGHNKWDFTRSVVELEPDVIVELWRLTDGESAVLRERGYSQTGPQGAWVRRRLSPTPAATTTGAAQVTD